MPRHPLPPLVISLGLGACGGEVQVQHKAVPDHGPARVELPVADERIDQCWERFRDGAARFYIGGGDEPAEYDYNGLLVDRDGGFRQMTLGPHDAYLFDGGGYQGRSSEYVDDDEGLPFEAEYLVQVEPAGAASTSVSVEARKYRVRVGSRAVITHAGSEEITRPVPPSRWDEYRVILCLAACLGVEKPLLATLTPPHIDPKSDWLKNCRGFQLRAPKP